MKDLAIGIDLGGTNTRIGLFNRKGKTLISEEFPTESYKPAKLIVQSLSTQIKELLKKANCSLNRIKGIGIGAAGFLSSEKGVIYFSPNLPAFNNFLLAKYLESNLKIKTFLENDANAAAIGEHWLGSARGVNNLIFVTLGTGVGSGIILDGKIWRGTHGFAGELGHITLFPNGLPCKCGRRGCVEVYCSAPAIVRIALEKLKKHPDSSLNKYSNKLTSQIVYKQALKGDPLAKSIFKLIGTYLGMTLANVFNLLDLEMAVIGGKVAEAGNLIINPIREEIEKLAISSPYHRLLVLKSKLGNKAGMLGAAFLVFKKNQD